MMITVDSAEGTFELDVTEGSRVLDVLQARGIDIPAACGGHGKCGKCQVLVKDDTGLNYRLACMTEVSEGMEVIVEHREAMTVLEDGVSQSFPPDQGLTGFGMAVDIGTTTVVAHLHDLESGMRIATVSRANPQIAFGADVISRITASVDGKLDLMTTSIQDALRTMRDKLCKAAMIDPGMVSRITIAGNTTMEHIAVGLPPDTIGVNPFTPLSLFGDEWEVEDLGNCYLLPCVAGYVGGDITAGMLVRGLEGDGTHLFLDLGTNGEMALSHNGSIVCCATAAGPVFEGANVHFGMPAAPGAISSVSFEEGGIRTTVLGDVAPIGVCGTGIIDAVATMVRIGAVDETGYLLEADEAPETIARYLGDEDGVRVFYITDDHSVYITQKDVRSMQLAKAAVCAGILTMVEEQGITVDQIESLEIAGGFGRFLNLESAAAIGLFPSGLLDRASSVGNTSAEGASAVLISSAARNSLDGILAACRYLELSLSPTFNEIYVTRMEFSTDDVSD